jgi:hypothetical protein
MPFLDLSQDDAAMRRIMVDLGLAKPDEPVVATPLAGGVSSGIYRVDLRSGSYCVKQALPQLKVAKEWKVPVRARLLTRSAGCAPCSRHRARPRAARARPGRRQQELRHALPGPEYRNWKADLLAGQS